MSRGWEWTPGLGYRKVEQPSYEGLLVAPDPPPRPPETPEQTVRRLERELDEAKRARARVYGELDAK